jgi:hypothetical protein
MSGSYFEELAAKVSILAKDIHKLEYDIEGKKEMYKHNLELLSSIIQFEIDSL